MPIKGLVSISTNVAISHNYGYVKLTFYNSVAENNLS